MTTESDKHFGRDTHTLFTNKPKCPECGSLDVLQQGYPHNHRHPPIHPTEKPVALCEYLIRTYSNEGDLVLDNCIGSGTTAEACIRSGRQFIGFEKERVYFDKAQERIKKAQEQGKITGWF